MSRTNSPKPKGSMTPKISSPIDSILRLSQSASVFVEQVNPLSPSRDNYKHLDDADAQEVPEDNTVAIPLDERHSPGQQSRETTQHQYQQQQQQQYQQQQQQQYHQQQQHQAQQGIYVQPQAQIVLVDPLVEDISVKNWLYIFIFQGVGSFIVNFGLNFLIAWAMYKDSPGNVVFLATGLTSIVADLAVTAFVIPAASCIIGTLLVKNDLRQGKTCNPIDSRWLKQFKIFRAIPTDPRWRMLIPRALVIGIYFWLLFFPFSLLIVWAAHPNGFPAEWNYIAFKGYWGGLEGFLCMPIIAFIPMCTKQVKPVPLPVQPGQVSHAIPAHQAV